MRNRFILRFDDLCPTANWTRWSPVEVILVEFGLKPIVAVVPDNRDEELVRGCPDENFWDRVRSWQRRGWSIGLHGYQHCYVTNDPGMYGRTDRSEFAGLSPELQELKLREALRIFHQNGVRPDVWVAPAHSFDANTVEILLRLGVRIISDGYALFPYEDGQGMVWIPQQLGRFRKLPIGIWTVCFHPNRWNDAELNRFREDLRHFRQDVTSVEEVLQQFCNHQRNWVDASAARLLDVSLRMGRPLRKALGRCLPGG